MEILGFSLAVLAGFSLGIMGSGGSILTVPILVYVMGVDMVAATAFSLFIVGLSSLIGAGQRIYKKQVDLKTALFFGVPSLVAVYITRSNIMPLIPVDWFGIENGKSLILMLLFALLMLVASYSMLTSSPHCDETKKVRFSNYSFIIILGIIEGTISGLVGAGGGFLIVPALVLICKMDIKRAIGTSLLIVGIKSLVGFAGHLKTGAVVDWNLVLIFAACTVIGIVIGIALSSKFSSERLKRFFAYFVITMALVIVVKELARFF